MTVEESFRSWCWCFCYNTNPCATLNTGEFLYGRPTRAKKLFKKWV